MGCCCSSGRVGLRRGSVDSPATQTRPPSAARESGVHETASVSSCPDQQMAWEAASTWGIGSCAQSLQSSLAYYAQRFDRARVRFGVERNILSTLYGMGDACWSGGDTDPSIGRLGSYPGTIPFGRDMPYSIGRRA